MFPCNVVFLLLCCFRTFFRGQNASRLIVIVIFPDMAVVGESVYMARCATTGCGSSATVKINSRTSVSRSVSRSESRTTVSSLSASCK